jgi:four helix bundle protein
MRGNADGSTEDVDEARNWILEESRATGTDLRKRTEDFAIPVVELFRDLPRRDEARVLGSQFLRSGTSIGAQYCEAYRSRSVAEYVSKLGGPLQEAEETAYWMRVCRRSGALPPDRTEPVEQEAREVTAIFTASMATARRRARTE